jgi:hypothetical protein
LAIYNPHSSDKIRYIRENNESSDCNTNTKEELITIDKKNYILVSGSAELQGLYETSKTDSDGDNVSTVCDFKPIYIYE